MQNDGTQLFFNPHEALVAIYLDGVAHAGKVRALGGPARPAPALRTDPVGYLESQEQLQWTQSDRGTQLPAVPGV